MLGLADRGLVLDLFEKVMGGQIAEALAGLGALYDRGADPLAIMQDLLEIVHFLTRVKVAPNAEGFFDGSSGEAKRSVEMAAKLSVPALTRAWSMLLKGLFEVRDAARPVAACEMALIRLSYAADLPPTDKLVRDLLDGGSVPASRSNPPLEGGSKTGSRVSANAASGRGIGEAVDPSRKILRCARIFRPSLKRRVGIWRLRLAPNRHSPQPSVPSKTSPRSPRPRARRC